MPAAVDRAVRVRADHLHMPADFSLRYRPFPLMVPPVPTPATKCVTLPAVCSQISGAVPS